MPQFADDSMTPAPIKVSRDECKNEIPSDRPYHQDTTAGEGDAINYEGPQYANDFGAGYGSYGQSVEDKGKSPSHERSSVDVARTPRGKES